MASITMEQVKKMNDKMHNSFVFDEYGFVYGQGKGCVKDIKTSENKFLKCQLYFATNRQAENIPTLSIREFTRTGTGMASSSGLGYTKAVGEPVARKNFKLLQELTKQFDDETLIKLATENSVQLKNAYIF